MTDHELLMAVVMFGIMFLFCDAVWKIFGTQRRLNRLEKYVRQLNPAAKFDD